MQHIRRAEPGGITIVYGIATDSERFQFVRLDEECVLAVSNTLIMPDDCEEIYHWIDSILAAAAYASPQTIPGKARRFPKTPAIFKENIERPLFENAGSTFADVDNWIQCSSDAEVLEVTDPNGSPV